MAGGQRPSAPAKAFTLGSVEQRKPYVRQLAGELVDRRRLRATAVMK
ncbi:hypothetical protein ACGFY9_02275 [Streptomyces sp. NPDC048504]